MLHQWMPHLRCGGRLPSARRGRGFRTCLASLTAALVVTFAAAALAAEEWQAQWDQLVADARKEGKIVVSGPIGNNWQEVLSSFEKDFGIKAEYTGNWGRDFYPRLAQERRVGKYLWDIRAVAAGIETYELLPEGTFDPVRDLLIRPDVIGDENWYGGLNANFSDKTKKYFFHFGLNAIPVAWVNRDFVPESQVKTLKDILKPEMKGKISIQDMRTGAAVIGLSPVLANKDYGADFVRALVHDQKAPIVKNSRQQVEWLVRGTYPIGVVITSDMLASFTAQGLGKSVVPLDEGLPAASSGFGGLIAIDKPPHPAATKLYANWLLTKDVQQRIAKIVGYNSRRKDVEPGDKQTVVDVKRLDDYVDVQKEDFLPYYGQVIQLARELDK
jgi:iron(III) transport system substrate-binding protein